MQNDFLCCTNNQAETAILTCKVQEVVVHPTGDSLKHVVSSKLLNNYPIKVDDVTNPHTIFGPDLSGMQGKKARRKLDRV